MDDAPASYAAAAPSTSVEVAGVRFAGADDATLSPTAAAAITGADTLVIAPSNPIVSIGPLLAVPGLRELVESQGGEIELELAEDLPSLLMHRDHLDTAVRNLLDNAAIHGGGKAVRVRARRRGPRVEISVRDAGPGISPANRERIFERFFTTARGAGGTGLGLSIVRAVADARGGSVEFDSGPDGSEFRLVL